MKSQCLIRLEVIDEEAWEKRTLRDVEPYILAEARNGTSYVYWRDDSGHVLALNTGTNHIFYTHKKPQEVMIGRVIGKFQAVLKE